jgi:RHH-type proline utilization regulon transcriptional repressor/proline dehydrogenase/delta 1-pyrroline-5-carboxylate dehydrogenase
MSKEYSVFLQKAIENLAKVKGKTLTDDERKLESISLAKQLWMAASALQTRKSKRLGKQLSLMMMDASGKAFTTALSDRCFRSKAAACRVDECVYLLDVYGIPKYFNFYKRAQLFLFRHVAPLCPSIFAFFLEYAIRKETKSVVLFGKIGALIKHLRKRKKEGAKLNINHLGEAILGEKECSHRLSVYLRDLESTEIECVSVKISTLFSQIHLIAWEDTLEVLSDRLKKLYRAAMKNSLKHKFVNLDMEEYRDLRLTKELFMKVLSEPEFFSFSAGIALQAYLPDSFLIQQELTEWAKKRVKQGGAPIKIRLVKGANLAMEQVEASIRRWPQAPYLSKADADANYKKMVRYGCDKEHAQVVHLGIASHNVFDIAHALVLSRENEVEAFVEFEMLEGMADSLRKALQELSGNILLYAPSATKEEFPSAIAYLIRRLDENTGAENFLRASFGLTTDSLDWQKEAKKFEEACDKAGSTFTGSFRVQNRFNEPQELALEAPFENEPDTDFSLPDNQRWAKEIITTWQNKEIGIIPCVIAGGERVFNEVEEGIDPSTNRVCYHYCLADSFAVEEALCHAKKEEEKWAETPVIERAKLLSNVAKGLRQKRKDLIGAMMRDGAKSILEADPEVSEAIDFAEYYLRSMQEFNRHADITWKPKGTIVVTPPWNFPVSIPAGGILAALAMGNCVLFKPAPEAALCGYELAKVFWDAGVSKNVLQFICCKDDTEGSMLIKDPRVSAVILTGATQTARLFMKMRPSLDLCAETGGKNAMIVTALSDRDLAIKDLVQSAFGHAGQKCSAASLAILEAEVYDDPRFLEQLKDAVESLHTSSVWDLSVKMPPLIRPPGKDLYRALTTLEPNETWLVEPKQNPENPNLWSAGVKLGVAPGSFLHQTECFGPVLAVMRAKDLDHAIELANAVSYGLTSGIQSLDEREINLWQRKIEAGNLYVNRSITGAIVRRQPFGGCKASSFGLGIKAGGPHYLFCCAKAEQRSLPLQRCAPPREIDYMMKLCKEVDFSAEEMGLWYASACSYAYHSRLFLTEYDVRYPTHLSEVLVGQDNVLYYAPRKRIVFRVQKKDKLIFVLQVLAAAFCVKVPLVGSAVRGSILFDEAWAQAFSSLQFIQEPLEVFLKSMAQYERVRLISSPTEDMQIVAAENGCFLDVGEPLANGRFELLRYLREVALSYDYHRYGNLGIRESQ